MKNFALAGLAGALALALPLSAQADSGFEFETTIGITTDYVWRGVSQTDEDPAIQAAFDVSHSSGFYAGVWGSNVDFDNPDDGIDLEIDVYVGWAVDLRDDLNLDLSVTRYFYPGSNSGYNIDYNEFAAKLTVADTLFFSAAYTNDFVNSDINAAYYQIGGEWDIGETGWSWNASLGHFTFSDNFGDYNDMAFGLSRSFGPATLTLSHTRTYGFSEDVQSLLGPRSWAGKRLQAELSFSF